MRYLWTNPLESYRRSFLDLSQEKLQSKCLLQRFKLYVIFTIKSGVTTLDPTVDFCKRLENCIKRVEINWNVYQINVLKQECIVDSYVYLPGDVNERFLLMLKTDKDRFIHVAFRSNKEYRKYSRVHKGFNLVRFKFDICSYFWDYLESDFFESPVKHFCSCYANEHVGFKFYNFKIVYEDLSLHCLDYNWAPQLYYRVWTSGSWYLK